MGGLAKRLEQLEQESGNRPVKIIWANAGEASEEARAKRTDIPEDALVYVCRWKGLNDAPVV